MNNNKMGKKEPIETNSSITSVSSRPSVEHQTSAQSQRTIASNKSARWFSLRRVFNDIHGQRLMNRSKKKQQQQLHQSTELEIPQSDTRVFGSPSNELSQGRSFKKISRNSSTSTTIQQQPSTSEFITNPIDTPAINVTSLKSDSVVECPLCTLIQPKSNFPNLPATLCNHRSCRECMRQYLRVEITESRVNIACPECSEPLHPNDIRAILNEDVHLYSKYEEFMLRRVLVSDPDARWCPAPDCNYVVIATGCASCPKLSCSRPGCGATFCYHCKQYWHPCQTCDDAKAERSSNLRSSFSQESTPHNEIKSCPRCQAFIVKMDDGSCNHMTCAICGAEFCWLCMKEISDLHYLSPSGCTFWGKKPWSRKKKILWQLGTLVGAPVGITLIAGIAVPAIIIGVPIWVGKRVFSKCSYMSVHKRNLATFGGVLSSILISPLLAAIAVGIGVPILLAYVYGVVPISLCRSGGCGVRTTNTGGVKIDFNETETRAEGANVNSNYNTTFAETRSVVEGAHGGVTNPSIGPSIGEMSLVMTNSLSASGSHLDRIGAIREDSCDRDSASHKAMAGSCIAESLSGSLYTNCGGGSGGGGGNAAGAVVGFQNRLEVQAEMSQTTMMMMMASRQQDKRSSLSSESANLSLDAKSVTVSFGGDNSSVKVIESDGRSHLIKDTAPTHPTTLSDVICLPSRVTRADPSVPPTATTRFSNAVESQKADDLNSPQLSADCVAAPTAAASGQASATNSALRSSFQRYGSPPTSRNVTFKPCVPAPKDAGLACGGVVVVNDHRHAGLHNNNNNNNNNNNSNGNSSNSFSSAGSVNGIHHYQHHHAHGGSSVAVSQEAAIAATTNKYRHYNKKQSMSVGDSIDEERPEPTNISNLDYLSVHSLAATRQAADNHRLLQQAPLECCPGGSDIVAMVAAEELSGGSARNGSPKLAHRHHYGGRQNLDMSSNDTVSSSSIAVSPCNKRDVATTLAGDVIGCRRPTPPLEYDACNEVYVSMGGDDLEASDSAISGSGGCYASCNNVTGGGSGGGCVNGGSGSSYSSGCVSGSERKDIKQQVIINNGISNSKSNAISATTASPTTSSTTTTTTTTPTSTTYRYKSGKSSSCRYLSVMIEADNADEDGSNG